MAEKVAATLKSRGKKEIKGKFHLKKETQYIFFISAAARASHITRASHTEPSLSCLAVAATYPLNWLKSQVGAVADKEIRGGQARGRWE
jgi:hypothetical protein